MAGYVIIHPTMRQNDYLAQAKEMILNDLSDEDVKVFLFGSRARNDNAGSSDIDVGIIPRNGLSIAKLARLREKLENSTIPYKTEIVDFRQVSAAFRTEALKDMVIWRD